MYQSKRSEGSLSLATKTSAWFPITRVEPYLRIPFVDGGRDESGCDCWGLIRLVLFRERGVSVPTYGDISAEELVRVQSTIGADKNQSNWVQLDVGDEQPFDIAVMTGTMRTHEGAPLRMAMVHVGIVTRPRFLLHTEKGFGAQHVAFRGAGASQSIVRRVKEIYRHKDLVGGNAT